MDKIFFTVVIVVEKEDSKFELDASDQQQQQQQRFGLLLLSLSFVHIANVDFYDKEIVPSINRNHGYFSRLSSQAFGHRCEAELLPQEEV